MPDETYVVELVAEPEKFAAGVRKAVNDLNKIEQTGRKIAAGEKASADASVRGYNAARARRDAAFSELTIVQKLVALEQRRAQLIGFMASAIHSGNTRRQALLGQGLSSVAAGSYLISASNPSAAREATTIIDTGTPNRGGGGRRAAGRRAPIALIGPPGDAGGFSLAGRGAAKGAAAGAGWLDNLGLKGMAKLTGAGFAISSIIGAIGSVMQWPGQAREMSSEAKRVEAAMKSQFEWSKKTRDNLAGLANVWTGLSSVVRQFGGTLLSTYVELQKKLLRGVGLGVVVDKFFPNTSGEKDKTAREMELRREEELAQIDAMDYFKKKEKLRQIKVDLATDINGTVPGLFSQDARAKAGIYSTAGGEMWSKQTVAIQRQLLEELIHNTTATKDVETAVKSSGSF